MRYASSVVHIRWYTQGMCALPSNHHLFKRNDTWHYRRRVPTNLVARFGKRFIKKSLGTKDRNEAIKRREVEDIRYSAVFEEAERSLADNSVKPMDAILSSLSEQRMATLVWDYVARMDKRAANNYAEDGPQTEEDRQERKMNIELELQTIESLDERQGQEWVWRAGDSILRSANVPLSEASAIGNQFLDLVPKGFA